MAGFAISPFGNGGSNVVTNVHNHYGSRKSTGADGVLETDGTRTEASWEFSGKDVAEFATAAASGTRWLVQPKIPAGAVIESVYLKVKEVFALTGTTPTILIGTDGSEATNGFVISKAQAEATGTYKLTSTLTGTWANPLAASTTVDISMGGTTPAASATTGLAEVIVTWSLV